MSVDYVEFIIEFVLFEGNDFPSLFSMAKGNTFNLILFLTIMNYTNVIFI